MSKYIYASLIILLFTSCRNDDDVIQQQIVQEGRVEYDGISFPLNYADMYLLETLPEGEVWALILSENYISPGVTYTDAYIYVEFFRERGAVLNGLYSTSSPYKTLDYAVYYEGVRLIDGNPDSSDFYLPDNAFTKGSLRVRRITNYNNAFDFDLQLMTDVGLPFNAYFTGYLR